MGSHKKTTSETLLELVNPVPTSFDPEEDINSESVARLVENYHEEYSEDDAVISSFKKNIELLEEQDDRYSGRKVSRKLLNIEKQTNKVLPSEASEYLTASKNHSAVEDYVSHSVDDSDTDDSVNDGESGCSDRFTSTESIGSADKDEANDTDISVRFDNEPKNFDQSAQVFENESDSFQHVSRSYENLEIEKGKCIRNQLRMWDSLLEYRIHLQKCLLSANKLPHFTVLDDYKIKSGPEFKSALKKTQNFVTDLLEKLIVLRQTLLKSYPETKQLCLKKCTQEGSDSASEEIPSDTEEEAENCADSDGDKDVYEPKVKKRKIDEYATLLDHQHKEYLEYRNSIIQKWNDKTRIASGKISSRNFSSFEQSTLKQIEQILSNPHRLIQRTQLKRSSYTGIGQHSSQNGSSTNDGQHESERGKEYDPEMFDDGDFYHQLLRELIERKTADVTDPVQLGRQWLELQKLRSKMKRKVDLRATKGRRIRYVVHPKLVNFMAPIANNSWTDEAKSELYNSLFGKKKL